MTASSPAEVTRLLCAWRDGDEAALAQLAPLVEAQLEVLAHHYLNRERAGHSLQTIDLVNEAYVRLIDWKSVAWQNRAHFYGVAAQMMRRILVDHARRRHFQKRGGDAVRVSLAEAENVAPPREIDVIALDDALVALAAFDARKSKVVELRFFGGLSEREVAEVLAVSLRTVQHEWSLARAWLFQQLNRV